MRKFAFILAVIAISANAQDSCRDILTNGFYNEYSRSTSQARDQAMYAELCSSNFQQAQSAVRRAEQSGGGGSLGVSYGLFSLNGGGSSTSGSSFTEEQFNTWKSQYCTKNSSSEASRAAEYLMQKTVAESVVNAWSSCMQNREGLICFASPYQDEVLLNISWKKTSLTQPQVQNSFLSKGVVADFDGVTPGKILPPAYKLSPGVIQIPLIRQKQKSILANVNINHDGVAYSCGVFIPGEKDFELTKPTLSQQIIKSPEVGCKAQAAPFGSSCGDKWSYTAPYGYKVCSIEIKVTSGPTEGASFTLENPTPTAGSVKWSVSRNETPFGAGRWIQGNVTVTYVPADQNTNDAGRTCNPTVLTRL